MTLRTLLILVLATSSLIVLCIGYYSRNIQSVTLWAGKMLAPKNSEEKMPNGFQDAITPRIQEYFNTILPICYLVILASGSIIEWYLGLISLIIVFLLTVVIGLLLPKKIYFYLKLLIGSMDKRAKRYEKNGDLERAEASQYMLRRLVELSKKIEAKNPDIPKLGLIHLMPSGDRLDIYK